jgi:5,10-methylenetetrahydrofolate reductase
MFSLKSDLEVGSLGVTTTDNRGLSVNEVSEMAVNKIISVSDTAPAPIRAQAHAFRDACKNIVMYYMQEAIKNHMCTIGNQLEQQGQKDLANIIRRL